jgi:hypothetical protein
LEAHVSFDPGGDAMSPVFGMQTVDDLLVSQDANSVSGDNMLDICPTLVNLVATLEQQFITIDNLLDEEDADLFMDDKIESIMTVSIDEMSKGVMCFWCMSFN